MKNHALGNFSFSFVYGSISQIVECPQGVAHGPGKHFAKGIWEALILGSSSSSLNVFWLGLY